jgi:WD40 repeat protein
MLLHDPEINSVSGDETIRLWDPATGVTVETLEVKSIVSQLFFSNDGFLLHTDRGILDLTVATIGNSTPPHLSDPPSLFVNDSWIDCGLQLLLWLPPDYLPTTVTVFGELVALEHQAHIDDSICIVMK